MASDLLYIGADLGTSALKLLLVDGNGTVRKSVSRAYGVSYPRPGWSEQSPEDWWTAFRSGIEELLEGVDRAALAGIGVAGQMHGSVLLDGDDRVIRPAILWNDGRTGEETAFLNREIGREELTRRTGNIAFAGFTAPKLLWLRKHEPDNFARVRKILLPKDYLVHRLTGTYSTDPSDASGTLLFDVQNRRWSDGMAALCGVRPEQLPPVYESAAPVGGVSEEAARILNVPAGVPVVAGAGDNAAAAVGTGAVGEGTCNISLGTSGTVFLPLSRFAADSRSTLHAFCHADGGWHLMGCILSAASCNKWFCEQVLKTDDYAAETAGIAREKLGKNGVYFLPYLMGERSPHNDTNARGTFLGMTPETDRSDLLLAVLEGVAFAVRDNVEAARALGACPGESTLCGGGAKSPLWRTVLASVLNMRLLLPAVEEGPGYGAAMLAMVGSGAVPSVKDCAARLCAVRETVEPDPRLAALYEERYQAFDKIYPAVKDLYREWNGIR